MRYKMMYVHGVNVQNVCWIVNNSTSSLLKEKTQLLVVGGLRDLAKPANLLRFILSAGTFYIFVFL